MTVREVWPPCMPAMSVKDEHISCLSFDDDFVRVRGIQIGEGLFRRHAKQMRAGDERRRPILEP